MCAAPAAAQEQQCQLQQRNVQHLQGHNQAPSELRCMYNPIGTTFIHSPTWPGNASGMHAAEHGKLVVAVLCNFIAAGRATALHGHSCCGRCKVAMHLTSCMQQARHAAQRPQADVACNKPALASSGPLQDAALTHPDLSRHTWKLYTHLKHVLDVAACSSAPIGRRRQANQLGHPSKPRLTQPRGARQQSCAQNQTRPDLLWSSCK